MIIELAEGTSRASVSSIGATLLSWNVAGVEVIDGYREEAELATLDGYRSAVLTPWSNRLRGAKWTDQDGIIRDVESTSGSEGLHGLFATFDFSATSGKNWVEFNGQRLGDDAYPYDICVCVRYEIVGEFLNFSVTTTNNADRPAPITMGWHPYFLVDSLDQAVITVPAQNRILVDDALIPLPGENAFAALPTKSFTLGADDDFAVTGLTPVDGVYVATLETPDRLLTISFDTVDTSNNIGRALFHLYSGGALARGKNSSVAIEPCASMTDSYNRPEILAHIWKQPGERSELRAQVRYQKR